jgi:hypothetical protein
MSPFFIYPHILTAREKQEAFHLNRLVLKPEIPQNHQRFSSTHSQIPIPSVIPVQRIGDRSRHAFLGKAP